MTRFNYLQRRQPTIEPWSLPTFALDNRLRGPVLALIATVCLTLSLGVVELNRLQSARSAYAAASLQVEAQTPELTAVSELRARLLRRTQLVERLATIHRANVVRVNNLAWIGNHLPAHTWLDSLRFENGTYTLEGTSDRATAVAGALLALRNGEQAMNPQLISLQDDGAAATARVRYHLRLQPLK